MNSSDQIVGSPARRAGAPSVGQWRANPAVHQMSRPAGSTQANPSPGSGGGGPALARSMSFIDLSPRNAPRAHLEAVNPN